MASTASVPQCLFSTVPVVQPPHLEGDPALATEILPGPPPLASIRQNPKKTDPKKPAISPSYLPQSDPGTTYTGLAGVVALQDHGPRRKRARIDRGPSNRAQRATARNLAQSVSAGALNQLQDIDALSTQTIQDIEPPLLGDDDARSSNSRSVSVQLAGSSSLPNPSDMNGQRPNEGGKGKRRADKESEKANVRVKEEPVAVHLSDIPTGPANEDHCSACTSVGALVYCDGCPRAYHLWCLNPPMDPSELPASEENWYCPNCKIAQEPAPKISHTFFNPLLQTLHSTLPVEFQLPDEIRSFFKDVGTGYGGVYVDTSTVKPPRIGRHGIGEERDPYRLKDHKGAPILCYKCGKSALPDVSTSEVSSKRPRRSSRASLQAEQWKCLLSCDYCPLHWHIDCLDPPLASLPPVTKKWKCPNHANSSAPKRRIPKLSGPPIDVSGPGQVNNGNIEIINMDSPVQQQERMSVEEVLINGRRYRVPERVVVLDFWNKIQQRQTGRPRENATTFLSPLTSLSSLDESVTQPPSLQLDGDHSDNDTLRVAELLCSLQSRETHISAKRHFYRRRTADKSTQTEPDESVRFAREDTEQLSGLMKAAFKQLDANQGQTRKERTSLRITRSIVNPPLPTKHSPKQPANGRTSTRSTRLISSQEHANHTPKAKKPSSPTNNRTAHGSNRASETISGLLRTKSSESEPKTGGSPFKIRIPGRTQLKPPSTIVATLANHTSNAEHDRSTSLSSSQSRPRRSSRRHGSVTSSGERSLSSVSTLTRDNS